MAKSKSTAKLVVTSVVISFVVIAIFALIFLNFIVPAYQITEEQIYNILIKLFPILIGLILIQIGVMIAKRHEDEFADQVDKLPPNAYTKPFETAPKDDPLNVSIDATKTQETVGSREPRVEIREVIKEVPVEVIKEVPVEKIVEKEVPVEVEKIVEKEVPVEKVVIKEVPIEIIKEIEKEVPVVREVIKEVVREVEVPTPVAAAAAAEPQIIEKEVIKEVPVEVIKEVIREVPTGAEKEVVKEVPVIKEVIKEVPIEIIKEVPVEVPVEKIVERIVEKEVPVEVEKIVEKEVPVEVEKIVEKEVPVAAPAAEATPVETRMLDFSAVLSEECAAANAEGYDISLALFSKNLSITESSLSRIFGDNAFVFERDGDYALIFSFANSAETGSMIQAKEAQLGGATYSIASMAGGQADADRLLKMAASGL